MMVTPVRVVAHVRNYEPITERFWKNRMTTEFDLACANCGTALSRVTVPGERFGLGDVADALAGAECPNCGGRYFPESTLERLH